MFANVAILGTATTEFDILLGVSMYVHMFWSKNNILPKRLPAPIKAILNKTIFKKDPLKPRKQLDNKNKPTNNRLNKESIKNNVKEAFLEEIIKFYKYKTETYFFECHIAL